MTSNKKTNKGYKRGKWDKGQTYSLCRHDPEPVFAIDDIIYSACSGSRVDASWDGTLVNLKGDTHLVRAKPTVVTSPDWEELKKYADPGKTWPDTVVVDWRDGGAPPVKREFWQKLHEMLVERESNPLLYCIGGHGRTGTALCALMLVSGYVETVTDAVHHIRINYCEETVETWAQEKYLYNLNGEQVPEDPVFTKQAKVYTGNYGWGKWGGWGGYGSAYSSDGGDD